MVRLCLVYLLCLATALPGHATGYKSKPTKVLYDKVLTAKNIYPELVFAQSTGNFSADGLLLTSADKLVKLNYYYSLAGRSVQYKVKLSGDAVAAFQTDKGDFKAWVDVKNKTIAISTNPVMVKQVDFLTGDTEYTVEITRNYQESKIKIINPKNRKQAELGATNDGAGGHGTGAIAAGYGVGMQHDYYTFGLQSGTQMLVKQIKVQAAQNNFKVLLYGDSITEPEGYFPTASFDQSWTQLVMAKVKGKSMCSGRGGTTINELLERIKNELPYIKSKYVMVTIGTNGGNTEQNLSQLVEYIHAQGSIPILNNIPSNEAGTQVPVNAMIDKIRLKYNIKGCKFDLATSLDQDGQKVDKSTMWFEEYSWGKIYHHPNIKGAMQMYERSRMDLPELYK
ncbi:SGNH/GDSL hydrolase family protein [Mucilaginibacter antarcticus]|uniref:SGNH/GDSL hydrolase family protein n=1 Tax=Mucilaginibacter antarcticus TaxID=1855725 RepID=A0ABW5XUG3_9SPHI